MAEKATNVKERILQILEVKGIVKDNFFEKIGISYGNFKGRSKSSAPSTDIIDKISSNFPDISIDWLITGSGAMFKEESHGMAEEPEEIYVNRGLKDELYERLLAEKDERIRDLQRTIEILNEQLGPKS